MDRDDPLASAAIGAMLTLAAERRWRGMSLADIARAARTPLPELRSRFACKAQVLLAYARQVEAAARAQPAPFDATDTTRDRLFELLMQRLDVLAADRAGVAAVLRDLPRDPLSILAMAPEATRLLGGVLESAGVPATGPVGLLRCKGLAAIWFGALTVWAADDSPDRARTMAALDRLLRQFEPAARLLASCPFSGSPAPTRTAHDAAG